MYSRRVALQSARRLHRQATFRLRIEFRVAEDEIKTRSIAHRIILDVQSPITSTVMASIENEN